MKFDGISTLKTAYALGDELTLCNEGRQQVVQPTLLLSNHDSSSMNWIVFENEIYSCITSGLFVTHLKQQDVPVKKNASDISNCFSLLGIQSKHIGSYGNLFDYFISWNYGNKHKLLTYLSAKELKSKTVVKLNLYIFVITWINSERNSNIIAERVMIYHVLYLMTKKGYF